MAFVLEDRVVETANNPGQGDFELLGAVENNHTFVAAIGNGNTTRYLAVGAEGWEIGTAEVAAGSPDRLLRPGTVTKNSDGTTTPVNFTGTVTVACIASVEDVFNAALLTSGTLPAGRLSGNYSFANLTLSGTLTASDADLGRATRVDDLNSITTTRFFTTRSDVTDNLPPGVTGTAVGINLARDTSADDQVQLYFTTSGGNLNSGIWARAGRDNWNEGATTSWWRFVMENPSGLVSIGDGGLEVAGNPVATVSTTSIASTTNFPIGHNIMVHTSGTSYNRNTLATIRLDSGNNYYYRSGGSGAVLSGTWRARGHVSGSDDNAYMFQRVA